MGRVAKYKKIKAFDPFSKQNNGKGLDCIWGFGNNGVKEKKRSRTAEKLHQQKIARRIKKKLEESSSSTNANNSSKLALKKKAMMMKMTVDRKPNLPPVEKEDEFDLENIQASLQRQKDNSHELLMPDHGTSKIPTVTTVTASIPAAASTKPAPTTDATTTNNLPSPGITPMNLGKEIQEAERMLKLNEATNKYEGRREHESKNAYNKRVKAETRQIILRQARNALNPEKRKRKKEFLDNKKKKKKNKGNMSSSHDKDNDDVDDERDFFPKQEHIPFGYQVDRPPTFHTLPRGATVKQKSTTGSDDNNNNAKVKKSMQTPQDIQAEQLELEKLRQKVQLQYAAIRAKRKQAFSRR